MKKTLALFLALMMLVMICNPIIAMAADTEAEPVTEQPMETNLTDPVETVPTEPAETAPTNPTEPMETDPFETEPTGSTEPPEEPPVYWHVSGTVLNETGAPIADAEIRFETEGMEPVTVKTAVDGSFSASIMEGVSWTMTVSGGPEYKPYTADITANEDMDLGYIRLEPMTHTVRFEVVNCAARYVSGEESGDADAATVLTLRYGSIITVTAEAAEGCELDVLDASGMAYSVTDNQLTIESLEADVLIRVFAKDVTAPMISEIRMEPEGWAQSKTLQIIADDNVTNAASLEYYISENEYDTSSGVISFAVKLAGPEYLLTENGVWNVYVLDGAGNMAAARIEEEQIDTEAPLISGLVPSTESPAHEVIYTFSVTDNGALADVTWTDTNGTVQRLEQKEDGSYSITVQENGIITVTATDMAGNTCSADTETANIDRNPPDIQTLTQSTWDKETNAAQISIVDASEVVRAWIVNAIGDETDLALVEGSCVYAATENGTYEVHALDEAGNEGIARFTIDRIDTDSPIISHVEKIPDAEWSAGPVAFEVTSNDTQSGVKVLYYTILDETDPAMEIPALSDWNTQEPDENGIVAIQIPNDINRQAKICFIAEDNVGRQSECSEMEFAIDISAPEQDLVEFGREEDDGFFASILRELRELLVYRDFIVIRVEAHDAGSGVDRMEYQVVDEGEEPKEEDWIQMDFMDEEIRYYAEAKIEHEDFLGYVYVRVYDAVGNCVQVVYDPENEESFLVVLENTPENDNDRSPAPVLTATADGAAYQEGTWTKANVIVKAEAEAAVSGINRYEYQIVPHGAAPRESAWTAAEPAEVTVSTDSNVDVYWRVVSNAENASRTAHVTVRVQKTPPQQPTVSVDGRHGTNGWYINIPAIAIIAPREKANEAAITTWFNLREQGTEVSAVVYGENQPRVTKDGVYELLVWATDAAGNRSTVYSGIIKVDTTAPTGLDIKAGGKSILADDQSRVTYKHIYSQNITVTAEYNCSVSGVAKVEYQKVYSMSSYNPSAAWTAMPSGGVVISPNDNCVVYVKVTDNAGNYTIVHTDGLIMDNTPPSGPNKAELEINVVGSNANGFFAGDAAVEVKVIDPSVNNAYSGLASISYQVFCDGVETQNETISVGSNGTYIRQTALEPGNNGASEKWTGAIRILAAVNNSDNIVMRVTATDRAGNMKITETRIGDLKIDTTAPNAKLSYDNNEARFAEGKAYFSDNRKLTIAVRERNLGKANLIVTRNGEPYTAPLSWEKTTAGGNGDDSVYTASYTFAEDGVYHVLFEAYDLAGNSLSEVSYSAASVAKTEFILDKTSPLVNIDYDNNNAKNSKYFDSERTAKITVLDANFDPALFTLVITSYKEGKPIATPVLSAWTHNMSGSHTATIVFDRDGDYTVDGYCVDKAGNRSDALRFGGSAAPAAFTIDLTPVEVTVTGLADHTAYNGTLDPVIRFLDTNLNDYSMSLYYTNMETVRQKVTKDYVVKETDGEIQLNFPTDRNVDGIYELHYVFTDMANHITENTYRFTVNRNGSVYEYSDDLLKLLNQYVYAADGNYRITEYNPSPIRNNSITITIDGVPITDPKWTVDDNPGPGSEERWSVHYYTIRNENFGTDGKYKVVLASEDGADNRSEGKPEIIFWKDTTAPEIQLVTGLEDEIVNAKTKEIKIRLFDAIGIAGVQLFVTDNDGKETLLLDESFPEGTTGKEIKATLSEGLRQHVAIRVKDRAQNITDSDAETFAPPFEFAERITVSQNFFTRWYANPWVFFGSIAGGLVIAISGFLVILLAKKRKTKK